MYITFVHTGQSCRHQHITAWEDITREDITEHFACWNLLLFVGRLERTHVRCDGIKTREIAVQQVSGSVGVGDVCICADSYGSVGAALGQLLTTQVQ